MARVYLSLGANREPERHLREALRALRERFGAVQVSAVYRSAAVGFAGPAFLNLACAFDAALEHADLRAWLRALEDASGRDRSLPRYADRTLDLDIALYCTDGHCITDLDRDEFERAHVLAPLAELAPALSDPFADVPLARRWAQLAPLLPALEPVPALE